MKRLLLCVAVAVVSLLIAPAHPAAQQKATATNVPEIQYTSVPNFLKIPAGETLGEAIGVATNSKGHISSTPAAPTRGCGSSTRTASS